MKRKKETVDFLKKGYTEMAAESMRVIRDFERLDQESLKYLY